MTTPEAGRDLVRAVVLGELRRDDPRVQAALAADPTLRVELDKLLATQRTLDTAGAHEREALAAAAHATAPAVDATAILRRLAARPTRARLSRSLWFVAAAAALLVALVWWNDRGPTAPPRDPGAVLGESLEILGLAREGDALTLRWRGTLRPSDYYRVRALDEAGTELLLADDLRTEAWTFPADTAASWPSRVTFEVGTFDLEKNLVKTIRGAFDVPR